MKFISFRVFSIELKFSSSYNLYLNLNEYYFCLFKTSVFRVEEFFFVKSLIMKICVGYFWAGPLNFNGLNIKLKHAKHFN